MTDEAKKPGANVKLTEVFALTFGYLDAAVYNLAATHGTLKSVAEAPGLPDDVTKDFIDAAFDIEHITALVVKMRDMTRQAWLTGREVKDAGPVMTPVESAPIPKGAN